MQLLHAVHSVEAFLFGLVSRKCNFHIAFFDDHENLCVPLHARSENIHKYLLARAVVIRHLQVYLPKTQPQIQMNVYKSYYASAFAEYLSTSSIYFVMCHDGASKLTAESMPSTEEDDVDTINPPKKTADEFDSKDYDSQVSGSDSDSDSDEPSHKGESFDKLEVRKSMLRSMIYWFARKNHYIALINGLQLQDTKVSTSRNLDSLYVANFAQVFTMVLEGSHRSQHNVESVLDHLLTDTEQGEVTDTKLLDDSDASTSSDYKVLSGSESQTLVAQTLRTLLSRKRISTEAARALVIHSAILRCTPVSQRRVNHGEGAKFDHITLKRFTDYARLLLHHPTWAQSISEDTVTDVADLIDGRILNAVHAKLADSSSFQSLSPNLVEYIQAMVTEITSNGGPEFDMPSFSSTNQDSAAKANGTASKTKIPKSKTLLPFTNPVFDQHLAAVHVAVDESAGEQLSNARARVFQDLTHWHNTKPIQQKAIPVSAEKEKQRALRNNQFFMREMTQYAASLTNAVGKILEPETIIPGQETKLAAPPSSGKAAKLVAENLAATAKKNDKKFLESWKMQIKEFDQVTPLEKKYLRTNAFLNGLAGEKRAFLQAEVEMYLLNILLQIWTAACREGKQAASPQIPAMMFDYLNRFAREEGITKTMHAKLELTAQSLGLPYTGKDQGITSDRPLSFSFVLVKAADRTLKVLDTSCRFQLSHCGPYFDRSIGSTVDDRVRFKPDAWQRQVLDVLDEGKSVFVVAPTSAGKTFISFYAMKQILKADDDGVLVYVAPTKALVNQIAAELQANFSKKFKHGGKSVWAIHTR